MKLKTFTIHYQVLFTGNAPELHITKVHNCMSDMHAKVKLETWLKKKHTNFKSLHVLKCDEYFVDLFDMLLKNQRN